MRILDGEDILLEGQAGARQLWNLAYRCVRVGDGPVFVSPSGYIRVGDDSRIVRRSGIRANKLFKPAFHKFGLWYTLKDMHEYQHLSSRVADYVLSDYGAAWLAYFAALKTFCKTRGSSQDSRPRSPGFTGKLRPLRFEIGRNARHDGNWQFRLTVLGSKIPDRYCTVKIKVRPGVKVSQVKHIVVNPDGTATLAIHKEFAVSPGNGICAVDLGVVNLATVVFDRGESIIYSGKGILDVYRLGQKRAAKCKPSGWKGRGEKNSRHSSRRKSYLKKATNTKGLMVHNATTHLVRQCTERKVGTIVVGDLRNLKGLNQKLSSWPRGKWVRQIKYKAEEAGINVELVSEAYTSKTCGECGSLDVVREPRGMLSCPDCGSVWNSDINGARNILKRYLRDESLGVEGNLPAPPSLVESAQGTGKSLSKMHPTWVAKFDLQNGMHVEMYEAIKYNDAW